MRHYLKDKTQCLIIMKEVPDFLLHTSFGREGRTSRWELQRNKGQSLWKEIPPIKDYVPVCLFSSGTDLVWMSLSCQARLGVPVLCLPCVSTGRLKRQHANYQPSLQTLRVKAPLLRLMRLEGCCFRGEIGTPFYVSYQLPVAFTLRKAGVWVARESVIRLRWPQILTSQNGKAGEWSILIRNTLTTVDFHEENPNMSGLPEEMNHIWPQVWNVLTACVMAFCNLWTRDLYDRRSTRWKRAMQAVMTHTPLNPLVHTPAIMCWACYQDCWTSEWVDVLIGLGS